MSTRKEDDEEEDKNSIPSWVLVILGILLSLVIMLAVMYYLGQSNKAPPKAPNPKLQNLFKGTEGTGETMYVPNEWDMKKTERILRKGDRFVRKLARDERKAMK